MRLLAEHSSFDFALLFAVLLDSPHEVVANDNAEVVVQDQQGNQCQAYCDSGVG